jgi:hypothetical protein
LEAIGNNSLSLVLESAFKGRLAVETHVQTPIPAWQGAAAKQDAPALHHGSTW